jgi:phenylacetate-coenzyme A ligase PaaK-like adenylate-forming protein
MQFDFSKLPLKNRAFSEKPMTFIDRGPKNLLASMIDLIAIETGNRVAREYWQYKQLQNLLQHAVQRSVFWRKRIVAKNIKDVKLSDVPVLTRSDVVKQVESEGSLLPPDGPIATRKLATSGSSGTPVQFFVSDMNAEYNSVRSLAQYFVEGRDLTLNRTRFYRAPKRIDDGFSAKKSDSWLGSLGSFFKSGDGKEILLYRADRSLLLRELAKDSIGYLVSPPSFMEALFYESDLAFLVENGVKMFVPVDEEADKDLRDRFAAAGIPVRAVYSSQEFGYIAAECKECPGAFHVAQSNVIVEVDKRDNIVVGNRALGRVLVTHLHSYATPFLRYDIGDLAELSESCECGYDGLVLKNIYGRKKRLLKRSDGSVVPFSVVARNVLPIVKCDEYRIRQTELSTLDVEIGGLAQLSADQMTALTRLFKERAGEDFQVRIKPVQKIDWGNDIKRLVFRSEML